MADPDLQIKGKGGGRVGGGGEGGGHPDPEIRGAGGGGLKKIFFFALWAPVWSNPSLDPPLVLTSKKY